MEQSPRRFVQPCSFLPPILVLAGMEQSPPCPEPPARHKFCHLMPRPSTHPTNHIKKIKKSFPTTHPSTLPSGPKHIPSYPPSKFPPCAPSHTPISNSIQSHPLPHTHPTTHINYPPSLLPLAPPLLHHTHGIYHAALGRHTGHTALVFKYGSHSRVQSWMQSCIQSCAVVKKIF